MERKCFVIKTYFPMNANGIFNNSPNTTQCVQMEFLIVPFNIIDGWTANLYIAWYFYCRFQRATQQRIHVSDLSFVTIYPALGILL